MLVAYTEDLVVLERVDVAADVAVAARASSFCNGSSLLPTFVVPAAVVAASSKSASTQCQWSAVSSVPV